MTKGKNELVTTGNSHGIKKVYCIRSSTISESEGVISCKHAPGWPETAGKRGK